MLRETYHRWVWTNDAKTSGYCSRCNLKRSMRPGPRKGETPAFLVAGKWAVTRTPPLCRETERVGDRLIY